MTALAGKPTLSQTVWNTPNIWFRNILLALAGSIALWISAKVGNPPGI